MANTHTAVGRMVLMNLANCAQFKREMVSKRTCDALQHMNAQDVRLGPAPYGYELSEQRDEKGRRILVPLTPEQEVLRKIEAMREGGLKLHQIARRLNDARLAARPDGRWRQQRISIILQRGGHHTVRPTKKYGPRIPLHDDHDSSIRRATELCAQGLIQNQIASFPSHSRRARVVDRESVHTRSRGFDRGQERNRAQREASQVLRSRLRLTEILRGS